jgi:multisubunit Na+/H+ antiporter MnhG subunit
MNCSAYPIERLWITLGFMFVVVFAAVGFVRWRFRHQLLAEIATTLGIFLLAIGTIVYSVAFCGLQLSHMIVAWSASLVAIVWFVRQLNLIMTKPLRDLDQAMREVDGIAEAQRDPLFQDVRNGTPEGGEAAHP